MSVAPKKWIVGLDLRERSQGAMHWAAWVSRTSVAPGEQLIGLHAVEDSNLRVALRYHSLDAVLDGARHACEQVLETTGMRHAFTEIHVQQGDSADDALSVAAAFHGADVLVIGRQALREGRYLQRLGRVARRLLRRLPVPTVVVPPDLEPPTRPDAPIVVACDLDDDSAAAVVFAADMAQRLGKPLQLVHALPWPDDYGARILPVDDATHRQEHVREAEAALSAWARDRGVSGACEVVLGDTIETLLQVAAEREAALLVTGSRRLSTLERVFLTSTGTEIAARASCAVAVVPPPEGA